MTSNIPELHGGPLWLSSLTATLISVFAAVVSTSARDLPSGQPLEIDEVRVRAEEAKKTAGLLGVNVENLYRSLAVQYAALLLGEIPCAVDLDPIVSAGLRL